MVWPDWIDKRLVYKNANEKIVEDPDKEKWEAKRKKKF